MSFWGILIVSWIGGGIVILFAFAAYREWHIRREARRIAAAYDRLAGR